MDDVIYEREMDVAYNADELAASLRKRDRTAWRLVSVCVCADGSYAVWERALNTLRTTSESSARERIRAYHGDARTYQCDNCNGSGRALQMDDSKDRCSQCDGTGRVLHEEVAR